MKAIKLHHPLADIEIKPLAVHYVIALKEFIKLALDDYVEEEGVTLSELRARMKKRTNYRCHLVILFKLLAIICASTVNVPASHKNS